MKRVYLVRHGETEGNLGRYFQTPETPLSDAGHKGAQAVAQRFQNIEADSLLVSPFVRAQQTAQYISKTSGLAIETCESLHECLQPVSIRGMLFDSPEGQKHIKNYKENFSSKDWTPEGAENFFDVQERVKKSVEILEQKEEKNIIVVAHGAFLQGLAAYLLTDKRADVTSCVAVAFSLERMSNVGISEFTYEKDKWRLFTWNDHAHFAE